ncbi:MAG: hypothetical protein FWF10_02590 [Clostridiales bacterium]|nr:hypothetical protein [Clostridiales bacterium]
MTRIWAKVIRDHKISMELVRNLAPTRHLDPILSAGREPAAPAQALSDAGFYTQLTELCKELDLACPAVMQKHLRDFRAFGRVVFRPADFMEPVGFDSFELERIEEKKKDSKVTYYSY